MAKKYLDQTGLAYLWEKIKSRESIQTITGQDVYVYDLDPGVYRLSSVYSYSKIWYTSIAYLAVYGGYLLVYNNNSKKHYFMFSFKSTSDEAYIHGGVADASDGTAIWINDIPDVVDSLTSASTTDALSANQGKILNEKIEDITIDVIDDLTSTSTTDALSANQGRILDEKIEDVTKAVNTAIYPIVYNVTGDSVSVASAKATTIATITVPAGTYIINAYVNFASNSNGIRRIYVGTTEDYYANTRGSSDTRTVSDTGIIMSNLSTIHKLDTETTYYLNVYQNSGSSLSCAGSLRFLRIGEYVEYQDGL